MKNKSDEHKVKVCHLTTVHSRRDVRIFYKQCKSLSEADYDVSLIVNDGKGYELKDDVKIHDIGGYRNRITRMLIAAPLTIKQAIQNNAAIYHFHDPELIPVGLMLSLLGKKVFYDVHEDVPADIYDKDWIAISARPFVSRIVGLFEKLCSKFFSGIVCATPHISSKFKRHNSRVITISNFPITRELVFTNTKESRDPYKIAYVGGIAELRGIRQLITAVEQSESTLELVGNFSDPALRDELRTYPGWKNVNEHGFVNRQELAKILSTVSVGMVTLLPCRNFLESQPIKLYEYMSVGIPVICSNFPFWEGIVEGNKCGISVDPENTVQIASAIRFLRDNPKEAMQMGENGQSAILNKYNWESEAVKLREFYKELT